MKSSQVAVDSDIVGKPRHQVKQVLAPLERQKMTSKDIKYSTCIPRTSNSLMLVLRDAG